jgi:hypothetical protein
LLAHGFTIESMPWCGTGWRRRRTRPCMLASGHRGCPGADHRCRTAGAGRMMVAGPASSDAGLRCVRPTKQSALLIRHDKHGRSFCSVEFGFHQRRDDKQQQSRHGEFGGIIWWADVLAMINGANHDKRSRQHGACALHFSYFSTSALINVLPSSLSIHFCAASIESNSNCISSEGAPLEAMTLILT